MRSHLSISDSQIMVGEGRLSVDNPSSPAPPAPFPPPLPVDLDLDRHIAGFAYLEQRIIALEARIAYLEQRTLWDFIKDQIKGWFK
jgi:hypothetical protein